MIVKLKQNVKKGKDLYSAGTIMYLSTLGYKEIPDKLKDVVEEVRVADNLKIEIIGEDDEQEEVAETKTTKKTTTKKQKSKSTNTLDLDNLDVNV